MTLFHELFDASAARFSARVALRHRGRDYSYEELAQRSTSFASAMTSSGVQRGDRVVAYLQNRPEVVEVALACSRIGAIFVPANAMLKTRQLGHLLRDSGACMMISSLAALAAVADQLDNAPALRTIVACDSPGGLGSHTRATTTYESMLRADGAKVPRSPVAIDRDPAAILYTSGSTGRPKGVVVSHRNLVSGATSVASYLRNRSEDRLLAALPLSFDYGFSQVSTAFLVGACAVLTNFSLAPALIQEIAAEGITGLAGVPTMWSHLAASEWPARAAASLRYITNSGGALAPALLRKLQARLPDTSIFCMYGLTEAFRSTYLEPDQLASRVGSIGKAIPNQEVLIVRPDGSRCNPGEVGELVHRGSLVTLGYWNEPELTRHRFRPLPGGNAGLVEEIAVWSGDLVKADEDGFLYFLGRNDQSLKTSGYRVSPAEVEEVVLEVPGVVEAIAVGLPDEVLGQRIAVAIVAQPASATVIDAVRQHCRIHLPAYMVPAHINVVRSIPRNANGKQDRAAMLLELQSMLAAESDGAVSVRSRL